MSMPRALYLVQRPESFDVMVTENMFGDILSDLSAALVGGMGMAPSATSATERCLSAVTRLGSRHRRARDRKSRGHDSVSGDDAGVAASGRMPTVARQC